MTDLIGTYTIDNNLCYALTRLMIQSPHLQQAHSIRGYQSVSTTHIPVVWMELYEREIDRCITQYTQEFKYAIEGMVGITLDKPYNLQYYPPGKFYSVWHCENNGEKQFKNRHLAFMTYLNTVEEGGETEFLYQDRRFKPEIGKTLVWPAYFTHTHRGTPAKTEKFIITGWYSQFDTQEFQEKTQDLSDQDFYSSLDTLDSVK